MNETQVKEAKDLAFDIHFGQERRGGAPYIAHPTAVAKIVNRLTNDYDSVCLAMLHDAIEDNPFEALTTRAIVNLFGQSFVKRLEVLTHREGVTYEAYIRDISKYKDLSLVKVADILHNITDNPSEKQITKYLKALKILMVD